MLNHAKLKLTHLALEKSLIFLRQGDSFIKFKKKQLTKHIQNPIKTPQKSTKTLTPHQIYPKYIKHHKKPKKRKKLNFTYSFLLKIAQINATNHNIPVNPKKKFMIKISHLSL